MISSPVIDLMNFIDLVNYSSDSPCSIILILIGDESDVEDEKQKKKKEKEREEFLEKLEYFNSNNLSDLAEKSGYILKNSSKRKNTQFINFNKLFSIENLYSEVVLKPIKKRIFAEIGNQFIEYVSSKEIYPIDYKNIKNKSLQNYKDFRKKKYAEKYHIPAYLQEQRQSLIDDLYKIGYSIEDINNYVNKLPTFERHYIVNFLNNEKIKENYVKHERRKSEKSKLIKIKN